MVLSLKVDEKNYLLIKQIQRCENINQLMWMLLISVTIAVGIFFVYMMFYTYKNAEESQFEITKIKYGSIPEINMNRNTIVIGLALMIIIFIFSHCYLKNKVSKIVRVSFEIMVSMYGFFFLFLISYLKSF